MNDLIDHSARCKELDAEYDAVGRGLLRIKVRNGIESIDEDTLVYCCLFDAACVTLQDSLFLLQAEADEYNLCSGKRPIVVIGVHKDWIDRKSRSTKRYLRVGGDGICSDIVTDKPVNFDLVHFIHFKAVGEIETYRQLTNMLKGSEIDPINPAGLVSDICDSKHKTFELLKTAGIMMPETLFFSKFSLSDSCGVIERMEQFLNQYPNSKDRLLFIQPDKGTEARQTIAVHLSTEAELKNHPVIEDICSRNEDTVVRVGCGNIFYTVPGSNFETRRLVIRVNAYENMTAESLSGYACIAGAAGQNVVAISRGAQKTSIRSVLEHLVDQNGAKQNVAAEVCREFYHASREIYRAVNDSGDAEAGIMLLGIDFVLEIMDGRVRAIVLDVNPRAVIAHSTVRIMNEEKLGLGARYWQSLFDSIGNK